MNFFDIFFFYNFFHRYRNFQKKYQLNIIKKTKKVYIKISLKKKKKKSNNMVIKITKISLKMKKKLVEYRKKYGKTLKKVCLI